MNENLSEHRRAVKAGILAFTIVMIVLGILNFQEQWTSDVKSDGVHWVYFRGALVADSVGVGSAGEASGLEKGDILRNINFKPVLFPQDVGKILRDNEIPGKPFQYEIERNGETFVRLVTPLRKSGNFYFFLASVGFIILAIGLYAFLKSRSRSFALHFYFLCLAFFGAYVFSPTGKLNPLDWTFFWGDVVFLLLLPPLFLHFAFYFPGRAAWNPRGRVHWLYLPSLFLLSARILVTLFYYFTPKSTLMPTVEGYLSFENIELSYMFLGLFGGVIVLFLSYLRSNDIIQRKQLKLVLAGIVAGFGPFCFLWLISLGIRVPQQALEAALVPQILIPLSLTYALFKYRLMDVDIIIKRGMIYTVTTMVLFLMYLFLTISWVQFLMPQASLVKTVAVASLTTLLASLLFHPLRERVRSLVDRVYYKDSYDYRNTLVQFSRDITSSLDIEQLSGSLLKHIHSTFRVKNADLLLKSGLNRFESFTGSSKSINPGLNFLRASPLTPWFSWMRLIPAIRK